jgi:hypothetical protein
VAPVGVIYLLGVTFVAMVFVLIPAIQTLADTITQRAGEWLGQFSAWNQASHVPITTDAIAGGAADAGRDLGSFGEEVFGTVVGIASAGVGLWFGLATIAMFTFYFTADAPHLKRAVLRLAGRVCPSLVGSVGEQSAGVTTMRRADRGRQPVRMARPSGPMIGHCVRACDAPRPWALWSSRTRPARRRRGPRRTVEMPEQAVDPGSGRAHRPP